MMSNPFILYKINTSLIEYLTIKFNKTEYKYFKIFIHKI